MESHDRQYSEWDLPVGEMQPQRSDVGRDLVHLRRHRNQRYGLFGSKSLDEILNNAEFIFSAAGARNDLFQFNSTALKWQQLAPLAGSKLPSARHCASLEAIESVLYLFGGINSTGSEPEH